MAKAACDPLLGNWRMCRFVSGQLKDRRNKSDHQPLEHDPRRGRKGGSGGCVGEVWCRQLTGHPPVLWPSRGGSGPFRPPLDLILLRQSGSNHFQRHGSTTVARWWNKYEEAILRSFRLLFSSANIWIISHWTRVGGNFHSTSARWPQFKVNYTLDLFKLPVSLVQVASR